MNNYRKIISNKYGEKLDKPLYQIGQTPILYLTDEEIEIARNRHENLFWEE